MRTVLLIMTLIFCFLIQPVTGQTETYKVNMAPFSTDMYDEFSPVYYKDGIVFCSDMKKSSLFKYSGPQNKGFFKIYYSDTSDKMARNKPKLLSKNISSRLNDGPVTFNTREDTIYYSRNLEVNNNLKDISGPQNKLGIYSARKDGDKWTGIREFRLNNEWYNITTPCLSPDGKRLYFASDKPGGFGGSDLYFCQWNGSYWAEPVNMGSVINSEGNESYPYVNSSGELFYSSDGFSGLGGKDIYYSRSSDTAWLTPVLLDKPVNSEHDDFGIVTGALPEEGYFSSNRKGTMDIYHFKTNIPQIFYSSVQMENQYCYMFNDNGSMTIDTTILRYRWNFGDGTTSPRPVVSHCFKGPGTYNVSLEVIERATGKIFFRKLSYELEIRNFIQPYISCSDIVVKDNIAEFDGQKSYLPGYGILSYSWHFGDGTRSSGVKVNHSFKEVGEFSVSLELSLKSISTGNILKKSVSKKVIVVAGSKEKAEYQAKISAARMIIPDVRKCENAYIKKLYSAEEDLQKNALFCIELLYSKSKVAINGITFKNVPSKYKIRERIMEDGSYCYEICQQMSLMATYPSYRELTTLGIKGMNIRTIVLTDPAEKELYGLVKKNGVFTEIYFDSSDRLKSNAYIMLDQLVKLMNKYPAVKLEVAVHSDNLGSESEGLVLTQKHSQLLVNYLIERGINAKRLTAKGFGESTPVASNFLRKDRILNQRIDFEIN